MQPCTESEFVLYSVYKNNEVPISLSAYLDMLTKINNLASSPTPLPWLTVAMVRQQLGCPDGHPDDINGVAPSRSTALISAPDQVLQSDSTPTPAMFLNLWNRLKRDNLGAYNDGSLKVKYAALWQQAQAAGGT